MTTTETQTIVEAAHAAIVARTGYLKHLDDSKSANSADWAARADIRGNLSPQDAAKADIKAADRHRTFADTPTVRDMDTAIENVRARRDKAQAQLDTVRASLTKPGDAAQESRNTRTWNRARAQLDNAGGGTAAIEVAQRLIAGAANPGELSVLLEELPTYLDVHKPSGMNSQQQKQYERGIKAAIDTTINTAVPEYGRAVKELGLAGQALTIVESSAATVRRAIASGRRAPMTLSSPAKYDPDR
jgi:hypothetical protein